MNAVRPLAHSAMPLSPALTAPLEIALGQGLRIGWDRPADGADLLVLTDAGTTRADVHRHLAAHRVRTPFVHVGLSGGTFDALAGDDTPSQAAFWAALNVVVTMDGLSVVHVLDPMGRQRTRRLCAAIAGHFPGLAII